MAGAGDAPPQPALRRWWLPPAMLRDPADKLEGDSIVAETPGDLGLLLWWLARDVTLRAGTPPAARTRDVQVQIDAGEPRLTIHNAPWSAARLVAAVTRLPPDVRPSRAGTSVVSVGHSIHYVSFCEALPSGLPPCA